MKHKKNVENIGEHYGIDLENELTSMLSEELSKSIDAEIMKNIFNNHNQKVEKINKIIEKINKFNE